VLLTFDATYNVNTFSFTLGNDPFGVVWDVVFVDAMGRTLAQFAIDQSRAGLQFSASNGAGVAGIMLPSGAFYDDISVSLAATAAVPEPSTWGVIGAAACGALIWGRRRK
jgi:hypothetical protein